MYVCIPETAPGHRSTGRGRFGHLPPPANPIKHPSHVTLQIRSPRSSLVSSAQLSSAQLRPATGGQWHSRENTGFFVALEREDYFRREILERERGGVEREEECRGCKIEGRVRRKLMRLLSFVPCGCRAGPIDDAPPASAAELQQDAKRSGDGGAAARRRRRRARSLGGSPQWRPALGDIYEEADASKAGAGAGGARVVPARAGRTPARGAARVLPRAHSGEYRHIETASSMPAFAPTAFLF